MIILFFLIEKIFKITILLFTITGTLITASSYSWIGIWIGIEINLLCIIPLIHNKNNLYSSESSIKYFITQALASTLFMFTLLIVSKEQLTVFNSFKILYLTINIALFTKIGAAPFHFWLPEVIKGLRWINCFMLLTWQKLAPIIILRITISNKILTYLVIISSILVGGIIGINQTRIRIIIAYSSINHLGWIIAALIEKIRILLTYFTIYTFISFSLISNLSILNINRINQLIIEAKKSLINKIFTTLNFIRLGGLPPIIGFYPKWLTINSIINSDQYILRFLIVIMTIITLYFYMRIVTSSLIIRPSQLLNSQYSEPRFLTKTFNLINIISLPICTIWFNCL